MSTFCKTNSSRRRRFVLRDLKSDQEITAAAETISKPVIEETEAIHKKLKKFVMLQKSEVSSDYRALRLSLKNISGVILFGVSIGFSHLREGRQKAPLLQRGEEC